jgi:hypothetical protein
LYNFIACGQKNGVHVPLQKSLYKGLAKTITVQGTGLDAAYHRLCQGIKKAHNATPGRIPAPCNKNFCVANIQTIFQYPNMPGCFFCFVLAVQIMNGELPSALKTSNGDEKGVLFSASPFFFRLQDLFRRQSNTPLASLPVWA